MSDNLIKLAEAIYTKVYGDADGDVDAAGKTREILNWLRAGDSVWVQSQTLQALADEWTAPGVPSRFEDEYTMPLHRKLARSEW